MKTKYEYDVVSSENFVVSKEPTRAEARLTKSFYSENYPNDKFKIIQRKYNLVLEQKVR